jgi:hypothetical protein
MMDSAHLAGVLIPGVIFISTAVVLVAFFNYLLKKRVVESGPIDANALDFLKSVSSTGDSVLKWGLLFFFGGLGLVIIEFLPFTSENSSLPFGVVCIFVSAGFLVYYYLVREGEK